MLGQHPNLYGVPELRLLAAETVGEWIALCQNATYPMPSGTLRTVSELVFGEQSTGNVRMAWKWLVTRSHWTTRRLIRFLGDLVYPRIIVDKSPNIVYSLTNLRRAYRMFPNARFIHLLRHPRGHGESVLKLIKRIEQRRGAPLPPQNWLIKLANFSPLSPHVHKPGALAPEQAWYVLNTNICNFLKSVPAPLKIAVRGEDLLSDPDLYLWQLASWIGVRTDTVAIEAMKHPEDSPYSGFGPKGASRGNDPFFLESPTLRSNRSESLSLEGPLSWRPGDEGFPRAVKRLARRFGYV
jgi:hypothetical protein